jgi:hypothetical protein
MDRGLVMRLARAPEADLTRAEFYAQVVLLPERI